MLITRYSSRRAALSERPRFKPLISSQQAPDEGILLQATQLAMLLENLQDPGRAETMQILLRDTTSGADLQIREFFWKMHQSTARGGGRNSNAKTTNRFTR